MVHGTYNELVTGAFVNQRSHHNGGPHIVDDLHHLGQLSTQKRSVAGFRTRSPSASLPGIPGIPGIPGSGNADSGWRRFLVAHMVS